MTFVVTLGDVISIALSLLVGVTVLWIMEPVWWQEWRKKGKR